jgi:hypothetical protein
MPKVDPKGLESWEVEGEFNVRNGEALPLADREALQAMFRLLREFHDVDFSRYRQTMVFRRISRRMSLAKQPSLATYATTLVGNGAELEQLHADLLLSITEFFRASRRLRHARVVGFCSTRRASVAQVAHPSVGFRLRHA